MISMPMNPLMPRTMNLPNVMIENNQCLSYLSFSAMMRWPLLLLPLSIFGHLCPHPSSLQRFQTTMMSPTSLVSPSTVVRSQTEEDVPPSTVVHFFRQSISALLDIGYFWLWILLLTLQRILWTWLILLYLHITLQSLYMLWLRMFPSLDQREDENNNDDGIPNGFAQHAQFIAL